MTNDYRDSPAPTETDFLGNLPTHWRTPSIPADKLYRLGEYFDKEEEFAGCPDLTAIRFEFALFKPDKHFRGIGTTRTNPNDTRILTGVTGLDDFPNHNSISPAHLAVICLVFKHEAEHVRQRLLPTDTHLTLEDLATGFNRRVYDDNRDALSFELRAHLAGFRGAPAMIRNAFDDADVDIPDDEVSWFLTEYAKYSRSCGEVLRTNDALETLGDVTASLRRRDAQVRAGCSFDLTSIHDTCPYEEADPRKPNDVNDFLSSGEASDEFEARLSDPDITNLDAIRLLGALSWKWHRKTWDLRYPDIDESLFECVSAPGFNALTQLTRA